MEGGEKAFDDLLKAAKFGTGAVSDYHTQTTYEDWNGANGTGVASSPSAALFC